jgi:hypothetical protein
MPRLPDSISNWFSAESAMALTFAVTISDFQSYALGSSEIAVLTKNKLAKEKGMSVYLFLANVEQMSRH